ncbi:MAG: glucose 1-dehydrogenase [Candidatus Rokubacteria bacterium]|nr:glucose 1-dehydrogenase [Candidatus Rokubacteria bacterium]
MTPTPFSLDGKTAIVTGGGTGIGKSIALELARAGADVAVCSRKLEHLEPVVAEIQKLGRRAFAAGVDVRVEAQVQGMVERAAREWGRLDVMVNNAGASFRARPEDISLNGWNAVVGINLGGVFLGCKWAYRQMKAQGGGVIINVASIAGVYGASMMSHYGAAKAAVINLTRALGVTWARDGVRVNCIAPGPVETEGYRDVLRRTDPENAEKTYRAVAARVALGRWGRVEEIAYPCVFLASDASSFMTGATIVVDGGPPPRDAEG